jgi:hypothetical protein
MVLAEFPWQIFMSPFGIPIAAIIGVFGWLAIQSISEAVAKVMCNRNNADLKMELVARGFSSDEITRVVEAGEDGTHSAQQTGHNKVARHAAPLS